MNNGISIALCTYNGSMRIESTLLSIFNQQNISYEHFELLIIDNASTDNTVEVCKKIIEREKFAGAYKIILEPKAGAVYARLRALNEANFNWLLICDDDNVLDNEYLSKGLQMLHSSNNIGALGGKGIAKFEIEKPIWFDKYYTSYAVGEQNISSGKLNQFNAALYGAGTFFNTIELKKMFKNGVQTIMVGPNQKLLTRGEDTEWCYLLSLIGKEIWCNSELTFFHHFNKERLTWNYYTKLKIGIASGAGLLHSYHSLLKNREATFTNYIKTYLVEVFKLSAILLKHFVSNFFNKNKSQEVELGISILKSKLLSYVKNSAISANHFKHLKKQIKILSN